MKLEYSPEAINDIQRTKHYISVVLKNRQAANRIVKMISNNCKHLKDQPQLGMSLEARIGKLSDLRYLICENWLVFYRVAGDSVQIVRVLDGRTDYIKLLLMQKQKTRSSSCSAG